MGEPADVIPCRDSTRQRFHSGQDIKESSRRLVRIEKEARTWMDTGRDLGDFVLEDYS